MGKNIVVKNSGSSLPRSLRHDKKLSNVSKLIYSELIFGEKHTHPAMIANNLGLDVIDVLDGFDELQDRKHIDLNCEPVQMTCFLEFTPKESEIYQKYED